LKKTNSKQTSQNEVFGQILASNMCCLFIIRSS